ncbi:heavy metal-associated isoprenylated plant protein 35 [Phoenix dactylifera]|uniref:Heavy metal-associated isoprenylated plant protein 35 n=1 Tax=Phoenix dactylifera TaxID=42345 RepID=A0A8B7CSX9_PHODC|nr:heavy metal-associated isoprenylated plant protein 35 [Phoenix dactylifera]
MASAEEGPEPLKYQTLTLKVAIHCEGCKKKVKKVLQSIEGVYKTTIDSQQQKVVVTGNVEAETLIKKLVKTGKHAELWPEKKPNNNSSSGGGKKNKNKNKASGKPNEQSENPDTNQTPKASGDDSSPDSSAQPDDKAPKNSGKDCPKADKKEAGNSPPPEKQDGAAAASSGGGGKKKGKKGQKENKGAGGGGELQVVSEEMGGKASGDGGGGLPAFNYPVYPTSQPPAYMVSYSSVQPSASYGGAYYPMSMNQSSYFYSGATAATAPGSYYIFSDENANACRIM